MVLLHLMQRARSVMGLDLGVIHVDHGLRKEASREDAAFVQERCLAQGVPFHLASLGMDPSVGDLEQEARRQRYRAVFECSGAHGYKLVATAHTLDDQAETLLYRAVRGTGVRGLAAMAHRRPDGLIRPLLGVTRAEIARYARENGIAFRLDATNEDVSRPRNLIRREVLPLLERINPGAAPALASLASIAREEGAVLEEMARSLARQSRVLSGSLVSVHDASMLLSAPLPVLSRLVIELSTSVGGFAQGTSSLQVGLALEVVQGKRRAHVLHRRLRIERSGGLVAAHRVVPPPLYRYRVAAGTGGTVSIPEIGLDVYVGRTVPGDGCVLRSWMEGDRAGGLKATEILASLEVPVLLRPFWPVLESGGSIVAVAAGTPGRGPLLMKGVTGRGR